MRLTPAVEKDLKKVDFCDENTECKKGEGYSDGRAGFATLSNGLTILGVTAGGDWESPLFYCIYYDGRGLRAYIPTEGNPWNTKTKKAYGNDEGADGDEETAGGGRSDEDNCQKRFCFSDPSNVNINQKEVDDDIVDRIVFVDKPERKSQKTMDDVKKVLGW